MSIAIRMSEAHSETPIKRDPKRSFGRGLVFALPAAIVLWAVIAHLA
ncbi:hypothetical protein H7F51_06815 [Novosphingobium flavum]|uniref:Uncharacterized protein n=1 Tax=Novosphingobium flavum TaxID=1778672 RepID=A0A7X1FQR3_9SPHN|nr:hypothetical protein [Novosphingobium flavum]MBC2665224.1 hypothetical protein [Novosphingobium flavum]